METRQHFWLKGLSLFLVLALLISCVPSQVYAMVGEALWVNTGVGTENITHKAHTLNRGVYEVTELREENVKHFALADGTYTAAVYAVPVHTQDANGNWQDIDNRLSESGSEFSTSNARIKFAKKITGNEVLFTLHDGNRKITMSLDNAIKKTTGVVTNNSTEFDSEATELQKLMTLDNLSSAILYADILDGVDLEYVVESLNVKENIIVKEANTCTTMTLGAYSVTSDWEPATLCYSMYSEGTAGQFESNAFDAQVGADANGQYTFNITNELLRWYADPETNFGIAITAIEANFPLTDPLYRFTCSYQNVPLCINYTNSIGVEDYWSFSAQNAAMAGSGYINNATGQLSFAIGTLTTTDSLFAFTPTLIYNQAYAGQYVTYSNSNMPYTAPMAGYGFKWNMSETLVSYTYAQGGERKDFYIWTDSDGTEHQFVKDEDGVYRDIDGLLLSLEVNGDTGTITDLNHNVRTFAMFDNSATLYTGGILTSVTDRNGNKLEFNPDAYGRTTNIVVTPVESEAIEQLTITYNESGLPQEVENATAGKKIVFYYSASCNAGGLDANGAGYLRKYEYYQDGQLVAEIYYDYDAEGRLATAYDSFSEYSVSYNYENGRVSQVGEAATRDEYTPGQMVGFSYKTDYTEVRTSGTDDIYGTSDDIISVYIFDDQNRVTSCYSTDVARTKIYGATSGEYEQQENVKNNIKTSVSVGGAASNYIYNGGFESYSYRPTLDYNGALGWTQLPNVTIVDYADTITDIDSVTGENSYAYFDLEYGSQHAMYQDVKLPAGQYTLSFDLQCFYTLNVDASVVVSSRSDPSRRFEKDIPLDDYDASQGFMTISMNFEAVDLNGVGYEEFRIAISAKCETIHDPVNAYIAVDNVMLEENLGYSGYSVVEFGNFEDFCDGISYKEHWGSAATTVYDSELLGNVLVVNPGETYTQTIFKSTEITEATIGAHTYTISGMAKGTGQYASGDFRIKVIVEYHDSTGQDIFNFDFQYNSTEWQFVCRNFTTQADLSVKSIELCLEYNNNPGIAYFDNIFATQVISDTTVTTEYYDGGLVQVQKNGYYTEVYEYDENNNLTRLANNRGQIFDYTYTETHNIATETYYTFANRLDGSLNYPYQCVNSDIYVSKTPVTETEYTYNAYGQVTEQKTYELGFDLENGGPPEIVPKNDTQYVVTQNGYYTEAGCKIFGTLAWSKDNRGIETRYYLDEANGYLLMVMNAETRTGTYYTYDAIGNVKTVTPATYSAGEIVSVDDGQKVEYTYNSLNQLEAITTRSTMYTFHYDVFGKTDSILVGSNQIVSYEYNDFNGKMTAIHYANGDSLKYVYDELANVSEVWYADSDPSTEDQKIYAYSYNAYGQLYRFDNLVSKQSIIYEYDTNKRLVSFVEFDTEDASNSMSAAVKYNDKSQITKLSYAFDYGYSVLRVSGEDLSYFYDYHDDGSIRITRLEGSIADGTISYEYDSFKRLTQKVFDYTSTYEDTYISRTVRFTNTVSYEYSTDENKHTSLLIQFYHSQVNDNAKATYEYEYDDNGNIIKIILPGGGECRYQYDDLGQLLREDNAALGKTYVYAYDNAGNITAKYTYALTDAGAVPTNPISTYAYGYGDEDWGDLLTSYCGQTITYDEIGNPLSYYNGRQYTFTWENGRRLAAATVDGANLSFTYNDEGIRTTKTVGTVAHIYHLNGAQIVFEEYNNTLLVYLYDAEGSPIGMQYRMGNENAGVFEEYWFEKNLQGDIVAVYDGEGTKLISYTYDAWGNFITTYDNGCTASSHANLNPFRYRGYYYDTELGMYYLQSRYYDPAVGRFLNADAYASTGQGLLGCNMFAYCLNNPISMVDDDGHFGIWTLCSIGAFVGGLLNYASQVRENYADGKTGIEAWTDVNAGEIAGAAFSGAISAIPGSSEWGDVVDSIGSNIVEYGVNSLVYGDTFDLRALGQDIVTDYAASSFLPDLLPTKDVPKYIRDIKEEARGMGVKGKRKLEKYLDLAQISTIIVNVFKSETKDTLHSALGIG